MNDPVNHPKHYTSDPSGIECIQITRHRNFNIGNAIKYLWRAGLKDKDTNVQDLEKAIWYIQDEIKMLKNVGTPEPIPAGKLYEVPLGYTLNDRKEIDPPPICKTCGTEISVGTTYAMDLDSYNDYHINHIPQKRGKRK